MPEIDVLRELVTAVRPPRYDELVAVARKRRRRSALAAVSAALVVVLVGATAVASLQGGEQALVPATPTGRPDPSPLSPGDWTPERTRAEGRPLALLVDAPSGPVTMQLYCAAPATATGSPCDNYHGYDPQEEQHWALDLTQGDDSALFDVLGTPLVLDVGEDLLLVQDGPDRAPRFRLLKVDGSERPVRLLSDPVPSRHGPDVVLVQALEAYRRGSIGPDGTEERPYLLDRGAGTLRPLAVPAGVKWWGPNVSERIWGGAGCRITWQRPDGGFDEHTAVDCQSGGFTDPGWNWQNLEAWLAADRMVMVEWSENAGPRVVHATLDRGETWQRVEVEDQNADTLQDIGIAIATALAQLEQP